MYVIDFLAGEMSVETVTTSENLEPIWMDTGLDLFDINGLEAHEALPVIEGSLKRLQASPDYYMLWSGSIGGMMMNYADYVGLVDFVERLRDVCVDMPGARIDVRY